MNDRSSILVFFAVEEEARPFRRWLARLGMPVPICVTGIGRAKARAGALRALADFRPGLVLSCGFAGGLRPDLGVGTVVAEADDGFPLNEALVLAGATRGRFLCADRILVTPAEKAEAHRVFGVEAVEMESLEIRSLCRERGIPSATVRVISDTADEALPLDFNRLANARGDLSYLKLAGALVAAPGKVRELIRFRTRLTQAADHLAELLVTVLPGPPA